METLETIGNRSAEERSVPDSDLEDVRRRLTYETLDSSRLFRRGQHRSSMVAEPEVDPDRRSSDDDLLRMMKIF
eukprot:5614669-Karenia_brevis.AAC.1